MNTAAAEEVERGPTAVAVNMQGGGGDMIRVVPEPCEVQLVPAATMVYCGWSHTLAVTGEWWDSLFESPLVNSLPFLLSLSSLSSPSSLSPLPPLSLSSLSSPSSLPPLPPLSLSLSEDKRLFGWGRCDYGQLGTATLSEDGGIEQCRKFNPVPTEIESLQGVEQASKPLCSKCFIICTQLLGVLWIGALYCNRW